LPPEPPAPEPAAPRAASLDPEPFAPGGSPQTGQPTPPVARIDLNVVTFEQLRAQNLSVTQATRLLAHRERLGGFRSLDDLDQVPGFPGDLLADLKSRATV
jgi:competence protein ComEA